MVIGFFLSTVLQWSAADSQPARSAIYRFYRHEQSAESRLTSRIRFGKYLRVEIDDEKEQDEVEWGTMVGPVWVFMAELAWKRAPCKVIALAQSTIGNYD